MVDYLISILKQYNIDKVVIGYSGGLDSNVMLSIAQKATRALNISIEALHINHNISSNSLSWQSHCEQVCKEKEITIKSIKLQTSPSKKESIEAWARNQRYKNFLEYTQNHQGIKNIAILLGHHLNDQTETFLLQAIRGAGLPGISAMPLIKRFSTNSYLVRPLIGISRDEIKSYAEKNKLRYIIDESNFNIKFKRNYLRHKVIPLLTSEWPSLLKTISRTTKHCAEAQTLLNEYIIADLKAICINNQIQIKNLITFSEAKRKAILRMWLQKNNISVPQTKQIVQIVRSLDSAKSGWQYIIGDYQLKIYKDRLAIGRKDLYQTYQLPDKAELKKWGLILTIEQWDQLNIRYRLPGDKGKMKPNQPEKHLKKIFQELNIPPWKRDQAAILELNKIIIGIYPFCIFPIEG